MGYLFNDILYKKYILNRSISKVSLFYTIWSFWLFMPVSMPLFSSSFRALSLARALSLFLPFSIYHFLSESLLSFSHRNTHSHTLTHSLSLSHTQNPPTFFLSLPSSLALFSLFHSPLSLSPYLSRIRRSPSSYGYLSKRYCQFYSELACSSQTRGW